MFIECPNCLTKVVPNEGNICPACRKPINTFQLSENTKMIFSADAQLPGYCITCATKTERYVNIRESFQKGGYTQVERVALVITGILMIFSGTLFHLGKDGSVNQRVDIKLPQCANCAKLNGIPKPTYIDFEKQTIEFIVNRRYKEIISQNIFEELPKVEFSRKKK